MQNWASQFTFLNPSFFICKIRRLVQIIFGFFKILCCVCVRVYLLLINFSKYLKESEVSNIPTSLPCHCCHHHHFLPQRRSCRMLVRSRKRALSCYGIKIFTCFKFSKSPSPVGHFLPIFPFSSIYFISLLDLVTIILCVQKVAEYSRRQDSIIAKHADFWARKTRYRFLFLKFTGYLND